MQRIPAVNPESATGKAKDLLDAVAKKVGFVPNMMSTMAISPAVLDGYLALSEKLTHTLDAKLREQIALVVAETNGCEYCASAHSAIGKMVGLSEEAILEARQGGSADPRQAAALALARKVALSSGRIQQRDFDDARAAGLSDREIAEVVANVALNFLTNSFNNVARTTVDFPAVSLLGEAA